MADSHSVPDNFSKVIDEFIQDLSTAFPEHLDTFHDTLSKISDKTIFLFTHTVSILPERFFDIIYQNEDIFKEDSEINTEFLPGVDFKVLFSTPNVSQETKTAIWKYLQLLLFSILQSVKNKNDFGDALKMFENIDAEDLQEKMRETMEKMSQFFGSQQPEQKEQGEQKEQKEGHQEGGKSGFDFSSMPNIGDMHDHLKTLFDGKLGKLAKDMAEEMSKDFETLLGEDPSNIKSTQDVMKKLMADPSKMMGLVKNIGEKLNAKMSSGDISQQELMEEVTELVGKMKGSLGKGFPGFPGSSGFPGSTGFPGSSGFPGSTGFPGSFGGGGSTDTDFMNMFKNMAQQMGGLKKNMRMDTNAMNQVTKKQSYRDKMKERLEKKKQSAAAALIMQQQQSATDGKIEQKDKKHFVFKIDGQVQEKSAVEKEKDIDQLMTDLKLTNDIVEKPTDKPKKKKGKK
jgi:hypothetical protein